MAPLHQPVLCLATLDIEKYRTTISLSVTVKVPNYNFIAQRTLQINIFFNLFITRVKFNRSITNFQFTGIFLSNVTIIIKEYNKIENNSSLHIGTAVCCILNLNFKNLKTNCNSSILFNFVEFFIL